MLVPFVGHWTGRGVKENAVRVPYRAVFGTESAWMKHLSPVVGDDLWSLIRAFGPDLVSAEDITRLPSPVSNRVSFKLSFSDGSVVKGKQTESEKRCERLAALLPGLEIARCSSLLGREGAALLEEWIPGTPLHQLEITADRLSEAGELMARLGRTRLPTDAVPSRFVDPERYVAQIERRLAGLVDAAALTSESARRLLGRARKNRPGRLDVGLIHNDFCPENLIVESGGALHVVDIEDLRVGPLDIDLARTWYRWPMTSSQRQKFSEGYGRYRGVDSFLAHEDFWAIWTLSGSALFRVQRCLPHLPPLGLLQRLAGRRDVSA